jgi:hypothetical protein
MSARQAHPTHLRASARQAYSTYPAYGWSVVREFELAAVADP